MKKELGILLLLIALCVIVAVLNPRFLGWTNLQNTARLVGMFGILGIGAGLVIITGGIDLSSGSILALVGVVLSILLMEWHWSAALAVAAVIAMAAVLGWFHGLLVTRMNIQPFVVTLCGLLIYRGLARFIAQDETKGFSSAAGVEGVRRLTTGNVLGLPAPFVLLIVVSIVMGIVLQRTVYGRHLFAVGQNEQAARYAGIHVRRVTSSAYVLAAGLAGLAGVLFAFYTNSISPSSHGSFYELYGIAAAVLGGCSLRGGAGSILGIVIGTALLQVLQNLVNLLGIPSSLNFAVMGTVILLGVVADQLLKRRKTARA